MFPPAENSTTCKWIYNPDGLESYFLEFFILPYLYQQMKLS